MTSRKIKCTLRPSYQAVFDSLKNGGEAGSKLPADKEQSDPDAIVIESLIATAVACDVATTSNLSNYPGLDLF